MILKNENEQFKTIDYTQEESVVIISINRPEAMNSFNAQLRSELLYGLKRAASANDTRVIIIKGNGKNFSAGADLKNTEDVHKSLEEVLNREYRPIFDLISNIDIPVIASVHGSAAGIGLSLALCCDLMIMSDDAFLLAPFTSISLAPDGGMGFRNMKPARDPLFPIIARTGPKECVSRFDGHPDRGSYSRIRTFRRNHSSFSYPPSHIAGVARVSWEPGKAHVDVQNSVMGLS